MEFARDSNPNENQRAKPLPNAFPKIKFKPAVISHKRHKQAYKKKFEFLPFLVCFLVPFVD